MRIMGNMGHRNCGLGLRSFFVYFLHKSRHIEKLTINSKNEHHENPRNSTDGQHVTTNNSKYGHHVTTNNSKYGHHVTKNNSKYGHHVTARNSRYLVAREEAVADSLSHTGSSLRLVGVD